MKKILIACIMIAAAFAANAQWVVGGNISYNNTTKHYHAESDIPGMDIADVNYDLDGGMYITFLPKVGYNLNNKWQVGAALGVEYYNAFIQDIASDYHRNHQAGWRIAPYVRYNIFDGEKLDFFVEAQFHYAGFGPVVTDSVYYDGGLAEENKVESTYDNFTKTFTWGASIVPGVNLKLNEHASLDFYLDMFCLQSTHKVEKYHREMESRGETLTFDHRTTTNYFGFNLNPSNNTVSSNLSLITVGFNYAF